MSDAETTTETAPTLADLAPTEPARTIGHDHMVCQPIHALGAHLWGIVHPEWVGEVFHHLMEIKKIALAHPANPEPAAEEPAA